MESVVKSQAKGGKGKGKGKTKMKGGDAGKGKCEHSKEDRMGPPHAEKPWQGSRPLVPLPCEEGPHDIRRKILREDLANALNRCMKDQLPGILAAQRRAPVEFPPRPQNSILVEMSDLIKNMLPGGTRNMSKTWRSAWWPT